MRKAAFIAVFTAFFAAAGASEKGFIDRLFFDDFTALYSAAAHDPLKSAAITSAVLLAGTAVFLNDAAIADMMKQKNGFNDAFFAAANELGSGVYVLAADAFLFLGGPKERRAAELVIESMLVSGAVTQVIKAAAGRKRPSDEGPYAFRPFSAFDMSMPSGHTSTVFSWAVIIGDTYDIGWLTYPLAALCGWARVYRNAHWPSDVLAGAFIGVFSAKAIMAQRQSEENSVSAYAAYSENGAALACLDIKF